MTRCDNIHLKGALRLFLLPPLAVSSFNNQPLCTKLLTTLSASEILTLSTQQHRERAHEKECITTI